MKHISANEITRNIKEMCIEANHFLSADMKQVFHSAMKREEAPLGKQILNQLEENLRIAAEDMLPICQDTGMAQAAASAIDNMNWGEIVGTIAGDDTIFVALKTSEDAIVLCGKIKELLKI